MNDKTKDSGEAAPATTSTTETAGKKAKRTPDEAALRRLRIAAVLLMVGIATEIIALMAFTPVTFMLFVGVGVPAMLVGVVLEGADIVRRIRKGSRAEAES